jgi:hypothetical protein
VAELGNDIKAAVDEQKKQNAAHKPDNLRKDQSE